MKIGDVVLFLKNGSNCKIYEYKIVEEVMRSKDQKIRQVVVRYSNANETTKETTLRNVRELAVNLYEKEESISAMLKCTV